MCSLKVSLFWLWVINPSPLVLKHSSPFSLSIVGTHTCYPHHKASSEQTHIATRIWKTVGGVDFELSGVDFFVLRIWVLCHGYVHYRSFQNTVQASCQPPNSILLPITCRFMPIIIFCSFSRCFDEFLSLPKFCCTVISSGCVIILTWCLVLVWDFLWMLSSRQFVGKFFIYW